MARPQKIQQERRLVYFIWEKVQEYCKEWSMPPEGTLLLEREWFTKEVVAMYVDCIRVTRAESSRRILSSIYSRVHYNSPSRRILR